MGHGGIRNRHDGWLRFCALHRALLAEAGLPDAIALNETRFRDLLRDGAAVGQGVAVSLEGLSAEQWAGLTRFAAAFFRDGESFAPLDLFLAYRREFERRVSHQAC